MLLVILLPVVLSAANALINLAEGFRCPVGRHILPGLPIQILKDNFNHSERIKSVIEVSNYTIAAVFQNQIIVLEGNIMESESNHQNICLNEMYPLNEKIGNKSFSNLISKTYYYQCG